MRVCLDPPGIYKERHNLRGGALLRQRASLRTPSQRGGGAARGRAGRGRTPQSRCACGLVYRQCFAGISHATVVLVAILWFPRPSTVLPPCFAPGAPAPAHCRQAHALTMVKADRQFDCGDRQHQHPAPAAHLTYNPLLTSTPPTRNRRRVGVGVPVREHASENSPCQKPPPADNGVMCLKPRCITILSPQIV